jgi:hypothetical protein
MPEKMMESLDAKDRMFDPTLLAMAQGFLTPGKTGSFRIFRQRRWQCPSSGRASRKRRAGFGRSWSKSCSNEFELQQQLQRDKPWQQYFPVASRKPEGAPETGYRRS